LLFSFFGVAIVVLAGCKDDGPDIVRQNPPHIPRPAPAEKDRMLAVLVTEKDKAWSFRLSGAASAVTAHRAKFDEFLKSIKFGDEPPLKWTLPEGWTEGPGDEVRFATIKTGPEPKMLDVTIVPLPKDGGELLPNVNRWRGQLSLPPAEPDELGAMTQAIEIDGRKGTLVDLVGKFSNKGKMPPMKAQAPVAPKRGGPDKITYDLPAGWAKAKPKNAMIREQFDVVEGKDNAETTIVVLPGGAGGIMDNLLRWRDQIKLPPANDKAELAKSISKFETSAGEALLVDLDNPKAAGNNRILGVILPTANDTYFLKMMGPSELVGRQKAHFEAFAKSFNVQ